MSRSITLDSASNTFILIALYVLVIDFKHLFCNRRSFIAGLSFLVLISLDEYHITAP